MFGSFKIKELDPMLACLIEDEDAQVSQESLHSFTQPAFFDAHPAHTFYTQEGYANNDSQSPQNIPTPATIFGFSSGNTPGVMDICHVYFTAGSIIELDRLILSTNFLGPNSELHVFYSRPIPFHIVTVCSNLFAKTKAKVISHILNIFTPSCLELALEADEIVVSSASFVCLGHDDEASICGATHADIRNSAEFTIQRQQKMLNNLLRRGLLTSQDIEIFSKQDIMLSLHGTLLAERMQHVVKGRLSNTSVEE